MKIKFVRDISATALGGWYHAGDVAEVDDITAAALIDDGVAVSVDEETTPDEETPTPPKKKRG